MGTSKAFDVEDALEIPPFQTAAGMRREIRNSGRFDVQFPLRSPIASAIPGVPISESG